MVIFSSYVNILKYENNSRSFEHATLSWSILRLHSKKLAVYGWFSHFNSLIRNKKQTYIHMKFRSLYMCDLNQNTECGRKCVSQAALPRNQTDVLSSKLANIRCYLIFLVSEFVWIHCVLIIIIFIILK